MYFAEAKKELSARFDTILQAEKEKTVTALENCKKQESDAVQAAITKTEEKERAKAKILI